MTITDILDLGETYQATIDGEVWTVPAAGGNRLAAAVLAAIDGGASVTVPSQTPAKRPLTYWAMRAALGPTRIALLDGIIAGMDEGETKTLIAEKWAARTGFVSFSHPHTQAMIQALEAADATFDADALWAVAEGYQASA